jgi:hypothetical protein
MGRELEPVVLELGRPGNSAPFPPGEAAIGDVSIEGGRPAVTSLLRLFPLEGR